VDVTRIVALPDELEAVAEALLSARHRADLVITSGGLGPTPDDLTREAIAKILAVEPYVDADLEAWLRDLWVRRGMPFPATNLKQAWLIRGADALPNPNGTAPGWWIDATDCVFVALPGPPRELQPMWRDHVLPRLRERGLGLDRVSETLRLTGIGESAIADILGEPLLAGTRPQVATYARLDSVDVRVWATSDAEADARSLVAAGVAAVEEKLGPHVFARGQQTWVDVLGERLGAREVATLEVGTAGQLAALIGAAPWLRHAELAGRDADFDLAAGCIELKARSRVEVVVGVAAREAGDDLEVDVRVDVQDAVMTARHTAFRGGDIGRRRAANIACAELWKRLGG
jgi:nicotinamide-nucleotide amidase